MQPIVVRIEDLTGDFAFWERDDDGELLVTLTDDRTELPIVMRKFWGLILLMAVRDRATSVHYHPWRDTTLAYLVNNTHYHLVPPPKEYTPEILDAARTLFTVPGICGFFSRLIGRKSNRAACSSIMLDIWGQSIMWDVVFWSSDDRNGVEFFRITPLEAPTSTE